MSEEYQWLTKELPSDYDYLAPDSSEIRLLPNVGGGGVCHCTLRPGKTSDAVHHKTVEEIWFFISGKGQVWRQVGETKEVRDVHPGVCLTIPIGTRFQFRNTGDEPLCFVIATIPRWPGPEEAVSSQGYWNPKS
jgi:mannose-6-phosphate isomerase-like protein (cupin superfamily)